MKEKRGDLDPGDRELQRELRSAIARPFDEVDWDRLHDGIMADAKSHFAGSSRSAWDCVTAWSSPGTAAAAAMLVAAMLLLWIVPPPPPPGEAAPPAFWPVAEELVAGLPEETRQLLRAGENVEDLITAMTALGARER